MTVSATQRAAATARVIDNLGEIEEIRSAWNAWRGHRDADINVYETVLASRMDAAKPHIIVVERDGRPDALMVGMTTIATVSERIGYWTIPVPQVRVLSFQYGGFLGNQSDENSELILNEIEQSLRGGHADVAILSYLREGTPLHRLATHVRSVVMRDHFPLNETHSMMNLSELRRRFIAAFQPSIEETCAETVRNSVPRFRMTSISGGLSAPTN